MKRLSLVAICLLGFAAIAAAQGDAPPSHWGTDPWDGATVVEQGEIHVVIDFEAGNMVQPITHIDQFGDPVPAWEVLHLATGVRVVFYRDFGEPLDLVHIGASEFGGATLSPFADPASGTRIIMEVIETGSLEGLGMDVARVSWEMGDEWGSDDDGYVATATGDFWGSDFVDLGPRLLSFAGPATAGEGEMGTAMKWVQHKYPIRYFDVRAGSSESGVDQLNSVYYDNFVLTFQSTNSSDGTVGAGSDAPSTDFGGGGVNTKVGTSDGELDEEPVSFEPDGATIDDLLDGVDDLDLGWLLDKSLTCKLKLAARFEDRGRLKAAIITLYLFAIQVKVLSVKEKIDEEDADDLIDTTKEIVLDLKEQIDAD